MGKALVIKDVDFGVNALTKVNIGNIVPCTGIALDHETLALQDIGTTGVITPTLTPADTTDSVTWESSNENVAIVSSGVVTVKGSGTAVITATCGQQTAQCVVTATQVLQFFYKLKALTQHNSPPGANLQILGGQDGNYAAVYAYESEEIDPNVKRIYPRNNVSTDVYYYAIYFAYGTQFVITAPSNIKVTYNVGDIFEPADTSSMINYIKYIDGDASAWDSSAPKGNRTINIAEGANCAVFTFRKDSADLSATDIGNITITVV